MQMTILQALLREVSKIHWTELLLHVFKLLAHLYYNQFQLTIKNYFGFPGGVSDKDPACQCRSHKTWVQSLDWEDSLEESMTTHFGLLARRSPMDRGAWQATVHRLTKSWTQLNG